jgi:cytochrome c oxidase cbb3-type subunit 3
MKKLILALLFITPLVSFAQETAKEVSFLSDPTNHPLFPVYVLTGFVFAVLLFVLITAFKIIQVLNLFVRKMAEEKAAKEGRVYVPEPNWIERLWERMNASVPVTEEKAIELEHNYDGIRELDNHLPPWWKWLFYATIVWSVVYLVAYHVTDSLPLSIQEYENQLVEADVEKQKFLASQPAAVIDENALVYSADAAILEKGKSVFTTNCISCHKADGGGNAIGPNLTDAYWLHGGSVKEIFHTVKNGFVEKGMPAWGKSMSPQDVRDVTFYVMSLQGTNPPDARAPQGDMVKPEETKVKADSTTVTASVN